ncbi:hypothetical protein B0X49_06495 [Helicobacter pylori]|uniref:hypothetical protein n=1 Tax=Helicobacter pylori TaxID=210 RepID=UPI00099405C4|nr:hypothetical protein B0X49_06495 [Helicobacter pylori]PDW89336.1 hypothetical protein BB391_03100 [Helicobacter pylori]
MRTKLSPNISLGSPIALAFGCFTSLYKRAYLKKPNDFGRSNTQARVYLFVTNLTNIFKS